MINETELRAEFERRISAPPFERDVRRWPNDERLYGWPGAYSDYNVQLAWDLFHDGVLWADDRARRECAEIAANIGWKAINATDKASSDARVCAAATVHMVANVTRDAILATIKEPQE